MGTALPYTMLRMSFQVSCFCLLLASTSVAEWQGVGGFAASLPQGNEVVFQNGRATVILTVLAADLIRVRMVPELPQARTIPGLSQRQIGRKPMWNLFEMRKNRLSELLNLKCAPIFLLSVWRSMTGWVG